MTNSIDSTNELSPHLAAYFKRCPGMADVMRRARELDKITPHLVRAPDGMGWIGSSDPRWLALYEDGRAVLGKYTP